MADEDAFREWEFSEWARSRATGQQPVCLPDTPFGESERMIRPRHLEVATD